MDQGAQHGLVADDLDVLLDAGPARHAIRQRSDVGDTAGGLKIFAASELVGQGNDVDGARGLAQINHGAEDAAVAVEVEVFRLQAGGLVINSVIQKHGAHDA